MYVCMNQLTLQKTQHNSPHTLVTRHTRTRIRMDVSSANTPSRWAPTLAMVLDTITRTALSLSIHSCCWESSIAACSDMGADARLTKSLAGSLITLPPSLQGGRRGPGPCPGPPNPTPGPGSPVAEWEVAWESVDAEVPP